MPTYYFDVHDHEISRHDDVGAELQDDEAARREAVRVIGDILAARKDAGAFLALSVVTRSVDGPISRTSLTLTTEILPPPGRAAPRKG